jgi:multiple sugar transport system ATP-binding protein
MSYIQLRQISKRFPNGFTAVKEATLSIEKGSFVVLLGPSGCGKTTTLRMIAGLEEPSAGEIHLDGRRVDKLPPEDRDIAFVFQFFALYPHMTVRENMAFPLRAQGMAAADIAARIDETAELLGIETFLERKPGTLAGGDRQRISLARALVRRPKAFLMDEPLGQCDQHLREELRDEIKRLHARIGATTIYVTHDQGEALSLADNVVLMKDGEIQQSAPPRELYRRPATLFAAHFIGSPGMAMINATVERTSPLALSGVVAGTLPLPGVKADVYKGQRVVLGVRPEDVEVEALAATEGENAFVRSKVPFREHLGAYDLLDIDLGTNDDGSERVIKARTPPNAFAGISDVFFRIRSGRGLLYDPQTKKVLS